MVKEKNPVHSVQMTKGKHNIIYQLLEEYNIKTTEDIQDTFCCLVKNVKEIMRSEIEQHLGYEKASAFR